jgi:CRISPR system Cascade subunit CasD
VSDNGVPLLILRLEGPLQSWGGRSRWDVRDTQPEPTKSGIVGLLGCALGYPVGDPRLETELDSGLRLGVRVEAPGRIVRDYQTIGGFLPTADGRYRHTGVKTTRNLAGLLADPDVVPATIQSPRYYLEDASFLVVLGTVLTGEQGESLLRRCEAALRDPVWPLYLGRKACVPTRPILVELTHRYPDVEGALRRYPHSWLGVGGHPRGNGRPAVWSAYVEHPQGDLLRRDAVRVNAARQYAFLSVRRVDGIEPEPAATPEVST